MKVAPLKFRKFDGERIVYSDDTGAFFVSNDNFLRRYAVTGLTECDLAFLEKNGHTIDGHTELFKTSFAYRWSQRQATSEKIDYVIIVPTLRCNLACQYCQVSRAHEDANGFDMDEPTVAAALDFLDQLATDRIKVEFQGGEPLLRLDLLSRIRAFCRKRFQDASFVVCTNLQHVEERHWQFLSGDDTFISTSLDGSTRQHTTQRTQSYALTETFYANLDIALERLGARRVSALPTIDLRSPPNIEELVHSYVSRGLSSIYLRPVNYHGFARKNQRADGYIEEWNAYYRSFLQYLIEYNHRHDAGIEEFYFSHILRRILRPGVDGHVDIRNPNLLASSYIVIDYDGALYPTDEARMLHRVGQVNLAIGHVSGGIDVGKVSHLNANSANNFDPDCIHCAYQPYCGTDVIDDLSRYGRVDIPRGSTWFCRRHLHVFDTAFEFLYSNDYATQKSIAKWLDIGAVRNQLTTSFP